MIKDYFYNDSFYKKIIKKKKDPRIIKEYKKILKYKKMIKFVYQNKPKGTGDAVLKCQKFINMFIHNILSCLDFNSQFIITGMIEIESAKRKTRSTVS